MESTSQSSISHDGSHPHKKQRIVTTHSSERHLIQRASSSANTPPFPFPPKHLSDLIHVEHYENGGGYALHSYADELACLSKTELDTFVRRFFKTMFTERCKRGVSVPFSYFCIGVIHGAAKRYPDLLDYLMRSYPNLKVHTSPLEHKNAIESMSMADYIDAVYKSYSHGIYRYGPMHSLSMVGVKGEERGCYFTQLIELLETDPFLGLVTPWGIMSNLHGMDPHESDDGPILWVRPGEQAVPVCHTSQKRSYENSDFSNLLINRRTRKARQILVPDRTPCHADHADDGLSRHTTAAIGLLKAVYPPSINSPTQSTTSCQEGTPTNPYCAPGPHQPGRIIKDVVVFDPRHYPDLVKRLRLDIMEPPASQCGTFWADDGELNQLHAEGFSYVRLPLRDNDIYFIPRNVVHQFKTVSAGVSIAWHLRLKSYYQRSEASLSSSSTIPSSSSSTSSSTKSNNNSVSGEANQSVQVISEPKSTQSTCKPETEADSLQFAN